MPITYYLERNAIEWPNDVALVELNPGLDLPQLTTWREYELIQPTRTDKYREEITWRIFDEKANRVANYLRARGVKRGEKVGILLMNCLSWLPIYFGILKAGAIAVPLNFRYSADEIEYCVELADVKVLVFGPEFIGRVEEIVPSIAPGRLLLFFGQSCPVFAENLIFQNLYAVLLGAPFLLVLGLIAQNQPATTWLVFGILAAYFLVLCGVLFGRLLFGKKKAN